MGGGGRQEGDSRCCPGGGVGIRSLREGGRRERDQGWAVAGELSFSFSVVTLLLFLNNNFLF